MRLLNQPVLFSVLFVAVVLGGCERRAGALKESAIVSDKGMTFNVQVYSVAHYAPERNAVFWCKSEHTAGIKSKKLAEYLHMELESDGWQDWMGSSYGPSAGSDEPPAKGVPVDRVHIVTPEFAYVAMGPGEVSMTFNSCKTKVTLSGVHFGYGMFKLEELKGVDSFKGVAPSVFVAHQLSADGAGVCFRLNPAYIKPPHTGFDVCSADRGATWYAMIAKGDLAAPSSEDAARVYSSTVPSPTFAEPIKSPEKPNAKPNKANAPAQLKVPGSN